MDQLLSVLPQSTKTGLPGSVPRNPVSTVRRPQVFGRLRLSFETTKHGPTFLALNEQQLPLRVVRDFRQLDGGSLVHLHNLSGGVLGGDRLDLEVAVGRNAIVQMTSTGATRIYRSAPGSAMARQTVQIKIAENGLLEYLPDQLIPFAGSRYCQQTEIVLGENAGLFWW